MHQQKSGGIQRSNQDIRWFEPVSDAQHSKRLKVLIWGPGGGQDHFTQILAATIQQLGYEVCVLSTSMVLRREEQGRSAVEGDILVYDLDEVVPRSALLAGRPAGNMSFVAPLLASSDEGLPRVRLVIALSSRSVSRFTLEQMGAVALLHKPFEMERLQRYLHVFQHVLLDEASLENSVERNDAPVRFAAGRFVSEDYRRAAARILVVEDHPQMADTIRECLEFETAYEVRIAHDGLDALEQCVDWQPDCIVTDLLMPYMNGYQVMRSLSAATRQMPAFVVISALMRHELPERYAYPHGKTVIFIDKPFQIDHLLDAVERALA